MPTASVVGWSSATFLGFGLFSRGTATMLAALAIGALTVSMAALPIDEMSRPLEGPVTVAAEPLGAALRPPSRPSIHSKRKGWLWTRVAGHAAVQDPRWNLDVLGGFRDLKLDASANWQLDTTLSVTARGGYGSATFPRSGSAEKSQHL